VPYRFYKIKDDWGGRPALIVGAGPTMKDFDCERLRGLCRILAVKAAMFDVPFADAGFGLDIPRFREWHTRIGELGFPVYWAVPDENPSLIRHNIPPNVRLLRRERGTEMHPGPDSVNSGGSSGFGALNVAFIKRPSEVYLFGFDHHQIKGQWHAEVRHYRQKRNQSPIRWKQWARSYETAADQFAEIGVPVYNASPDSGIQAFERMSQDEAIERLGGV